LPAAAPPGIETLLLGFSRRRGVVRGTSFVGTLLAMVPPTAERATQVDSTRVAGMRQEPYPATNAGRHAASQFRMGLQVRVQGGLILSDKRVSAIVLVPIRAKREKLLDGDDKKTRLSVRIRIDLVTPSSYLFDAQASRGRARFFYALRKNLRRQGGTPRFRRKDSASSTIYAADPVCPSNPEIATWKKEQDFFFPSSGSI